MGGLGETEDARRLRWSESFYDPLSRRTRLDRSSGVDTSWTWRPDSQVESIAHAFFGGSIAGVTYGYGHDASGKVTGVTISHDSFEWAPGLSYARAYGVVDKLNQVASETQGSTVRPIEFDLNGNMTSDGINGYQWTYGNRLIGVTRPGATTSYGYDSDDRRTTKIVGGVMTRTLWSGADEVAQTDAAGNIQQRFIPDGSGAMDGRLAQISPSGSIAWYRNRPGDQPSQSDPARAPVCASPTVTGPDQTGSSP